MKRMSVIGTAFVAIVLASCGSDPDHAAAPYVDTTAPAGVTTSTTGAPEMSTTTSVVVTTDPPATCTSSLLDRIREQIGSEFLSGTTPVAGGQISGGALVQPFSPSQLHLMAGLEIHVYDGCTTITLASFVRYEEYSRPVWRLADVVAVSARQGRDVVLRCTTAEYVGQAQWPEDAQYVALAQNDDPTPGSFGTVEAWRVSDRKRLVPVAPTNVRCPKLHE